ncbi:MAG: helix-turn-helix domain-containing protein [Candidatus Buchananbacteria bacterium]
MTSFVVKKLIPENFVGGLLKEARESFGLSLKQAADNLRIAAKYLQALEDNAYNLIPGEVYAKSFLKSYAKFLKLDSSLILRQYEQEKKLRQKIIYKKTVGEVSNQELRRWPRILKVSLASLAVTLCLVYLVVQAQKIFASPVLEINDPIDNLVTNQSMLAIKGLTDHEAGLTINGLAVLVNPDGSFSQDIELQKDVNNIKIVASKKHSQNTVVERRVVFNP